MALRPKLNRVWTSSSPTLRRDPGDAKYIQGWISEIPTFQVLNYLQYKIDTTLLALAERGIFEWGPDVQYGLNSLVWDETNKVIYISTVGSPDRTKAPSTNPTQWVASSIQVSRAEYDLVVAAINAHIADITGNPHKLTAGRLNAYNKTEIDNIVAQYRALVAAHVNDKNNPHQLTATIIGAVPVTGGTYTGDVTFEAGVFFDVNKVNTINKTGGMFLQNGTGVLGITDAGVGVVGTTTSTTPIVTEASYPNLKAVQEPSYAIPVPNCTMDLIRSINIRNGAGSFTTDFAPMYSSATDAIQITNGFSDQRGAGNATVGDTATSFTVVCDVLSPTARNPSDVDRSVFLGMARLINSGANAVSLGLQLTGASLIRAFRNLDGTEDAATYQLTGPVNTWYSVAMTCSGNTIKIYLNGVLVATKTDATATASVVGGPATIRVYSRDSALQRQWQFRNFRIWSQALTDKQVSTL